jgi:predicted amidohydrolase
MRLSEIRAALTAASVFLFASPTWSAPQRISNSSCASLSTKVLGSTTTELRSTIKVASLSMTIHGGQTTQSLVDLLDQSAKAAKAQGADLLMLPELWALDAMPVGAAQREIFAFADSEAPRVFEAIKMTAARHQIAVLGGSIPNSKGGKVYNTAMLAFSDGRVVLQDKLYLTPDEKLWSLSPGETLNVFDSEWGRAVILICYDCEIPKIAQALVASKPEIILVPSMTSVQGYRRVQIGARARSLEQHAFSVVVGAQNSRSIEHPDFLLGGAALFAPPSPSFTQDVERMSPKSLEFFDLDLERLRRSRRDPSVPYPARDQGD